MRPRRQLHLIDRLVPVHRFGYAWALARTHHVCDLQASHDCTGAIWPEAYFAHQAKAGSERRLCFDCALSLLTALPRPTDDTETDRQVP